MAPLALLRGPRPSGARRLPGRRTRGAGALGAVLLCLCLLRRACSADDPSSQRAPDVAFIKLGFEMVPLVGALLLGFAIYAFRGASVMLETVAILLIYFGAQTGMNVYMKSVLSKIVVDAEEGLKGVPIGFMLTAIQQLVAFCIFCCFLVAGRLFNSGYQTRKLTTRREVIAVLCFSTAFALNIGLNNFGLSLVAISINMLIRSCLPLSTAVSQIAVGSIMGIEKKTSIAPLEWLLMLMGVGCAGLATYAKSAGSESSGESAELVLGVIVCVASIFSGALNMVLAGVLGSEMKLNPLDTTCYMSLPASLLLLVPALVVSHPMGTWPGFPSMTDWEVLREVVARNPYALVPVLFSGVLSFVYNILQYTLVHKLSAAYAAFAGNFNKAATVALSLLCGMEAVPSGQWGFIFIGAVVGNIAAFTAFSSLKVKKK